MKTPYEILDISNNASMYEIKEAFRKKVKLSHPDLNQHDPRANEKFIEVTDAYKVLCDPNLKSELDKQISRSGHYNGFDFEFTYGQDSQMLSEIIKDLIFRMQLQAEPYKKEATKALWVGLAWFFGGLTITLWSYNVAVNSGGGTYFVTYGAIIFGIIQAIRGFIAFNQINELINSYESELWEKFDYIFTKNTSESSDRFYSNQNNQNFSDEGTYNSSHSEESYKKADTDDFKSDDNLSNDIVINDTLSNPVLLGLLVVILIILFLIFGMSSPYEENTQQQTTQQSTESNIRAENYLSGDDMRHLTNEINYEEALNFMSKQYTRDELKNLMDVLNRLDYEIDKNRKDYKYVLIAAVVHFQKENDLEVDGMAGSNTLKELSKSLAMKIEGDNVNYYIESDTSVVKEYGWNSKKVEKFIYFVSYEYDYDNNYNNGYYLYPYEVNLMNQDVLSVDGVLKDKYRNLGYLD